MWSVDFDDFEIVFIVFFLEEVVFGVGLWIEFGLIGKLLFEFVWVG